MNPQDRTAVRTASDIERKYNLKGMTKQIEIQKDNLYKLEHNLTNFANSVSKDLINLQDQVDGNITTWFSSGEPTLENYPVNAWQSNETHLGDLYYDSNSGYSYRFAFENGNYCWIKLTDSDVTEALELAKNAQDTADGKIRIFTITPIPPYDVGDLWLNAKDLYVCVKSKLESEIYEVDDFEIATKYTDDSALNNFINEDYKKSIEQISNQIDKKAETWCQNEEPSIKWLSEELKKEHIGDLWYKTDENKNYIYTSSYTWSEIDGVPDSIYDEIDGKAQIFTSQPVAPYYVGDLYVQGSNGDILVCITERLSGDYTVNEWQKASKYTDDTNLNNFVNVTYTEAMKSIKNQIDSKITTWYYKGEPTLTNVPAIDWTSDEIKDAHSGDLYYDKDTGYCYRFQFESDNYTWLKLTDVDVTKALAMANSAQDTADSKRRIFLETPSVPYDNGDMWIKDQEIYICQISKDESQIFDENDFIVATKYTDNTLANQVNDRITVVAGQVTTIEQNVSKISAEMQDARYYVDEEGNEILITDQINKLTATAYGLSQITTSAGGNNIIRNSSIWFKNNDSSASSEIIETIEWDGDTAGRENYMETAFKVSDLTPSKEDLIGQTARFSDGSTGLLEEDMFYDIEDDEGNTGNILLSNFGYVIYKPVVLLEQNLSPGIYFIYIDGVYATQLTYKTTGIANPYEFWEGVAKEGSNDNATNYRSILLQNSSFIQEQDVPNGNYSISFYYRKLISNAVASVVINDKEYPLDSLETKQFYTGEQDSETGEYIVDPIVVSNGHIKIEFKCDASNGVEVYDLMCNKGTVKLAYSQNQNETTTDTVNISKGITITSSADENTKFKADYDGIRILNKNNIPKTKFTDKGTETDELLVRKKATITGLLHQEVDDQTWVTKI